MVGLENPHKRFPAPVKRAFALPETKRSSSPIEKRAAFLTDKTKSKDSRV